MLRRTIRTLTDRYHHDKPLLVEKVPFSVQNGVLKGTSLPLYELERVVKIKPCFSHFSADNNKQLRIALSASVGRYLAGSWSG